MKSIPVTITTEASEKLRVALLSCINKIISHSESLIGNVVENVNLLSTKLTKWPNTLKQFVGNLPTNCLSLFGHFMRLALKRLMYLSMKCHLNSAQVFVSFFDQNPIGREYHMALEGM